MQTINAYLYPNVIEVQFLDQEIITTRNRIVYARSIKVYRGIDNAIQVIVKNQDQKPVDLYPYNVYVDVVDPQEKIVVATYTLDFIERALGVCKFTITTSTLESLEKRFYKILVRSELISNSENSLLYSDDNYGLGIDLEVNEGFYN